MWLINTATLKLEWFTSSLEVKYGILSHTWEGGEVSFQEFQSPEDSTKKKTGYKKIEATCEAARKRGLQYAWVDTCCIDKSSSAELSEAINSMFRWYRDSNICFAYLSDLFVPTSNPSDKDELATDMARCRWFTRGWTLQELIAPKSLDIYDSSWNYRGSRNQLAIHISAITGVDIAVLRDSTAVNSLPVARRMSWASGRKTSREEDMAYCLMGIFNVNMALLYGEGSKAFTRLQEEIASQTGDISLFAWTARPATPSDPLSGVEIGRPDPDYRGVLALSPSEFSDCGGFRHLPAHQRYDQVFSTATRGFSIDALLVKSYGANPCLVLTLDILDERRSGSNMKRLGISLLRTPRGFVRSNPSSLLPVPPRSGRSFVKVYMPKFITPEDCEAISDQFNGSICLRKISTPALHGFAAVPSKLWDPGKHIFLTGEMYQATKTYQEISTYLLFRFRKSHDWPDIRFLVICLCRPSLERPKDQLGDMICIVKNESDESWAELMTSMHYCDKYYAGDDLFYLRHVLKGDFSPRYSSTYAEEAAGITATCTATLTTSSSGDSGLRQAGINLKGIPVHYLDIKIETSEDPVYPLHRSADAKFRLEQENALAIALGYNFD